MGKNKLGLLGPDGTFSAEAACNYLRKRRIPSDLVYCSTITNCFQLLRHGGADSIIVPLSNSSIGIVMESIRCIEECEIYGNEELSINLHLAGNPDAKYVHTKTQIARQCRKRLSRLNAKIIFENSSAIAAINARDTNQAAIISRRAAEIYGLPILEENVQDKKDNKTLFGLIR